ncbi:GGDEF domain-containing protein [uncultured Pseudoteredinibacter sp.]|uniref:GGDEF domain-containing protein n=1 Tax=uncultured Pseudoteredinibacter sp. TaxID=1641701 RepID=UPI00260F1A80|nr:GGDEF domain-containing protein [uncultured Pseudoteredinibacter sp.]
MYEFDLANWDDTHTLAASNRQKHKLLLFICTILSSIYIAMTYVNVINERLLLAVLDGAFVCSLIAASLWMYFKNSTLPAVIVFLVLFLLVVSATTPIATLGVTGTFWCYPILVSSAFVLPVWVGLSVNAGVIVLCGVFGFQTIEQGQWFRIEASLITVATLAHVFAYKIRKMQELLRVHSTTDPLTGAYNRRQLETILQDSIAFAKEFERPCVLAILDLDNFKRINDELGHNAGDDAIVNLVELLKNNCRSTDLVFRHGGDEILLLLRDVKMVNAKDLLEKICRNIDSSQKIPTSSSIGASAIIGESARDWLAAADKALYQAKENGKNQLVMNDDCAEKLKFS